MEFRGIYQDGVIRPTEPVALPDGTEVEFQPVGAPDSAGNGRLKNWESKSLEELAREQGVDPVTDLDSLRGIWPEDESIDQFLGWLRESRKQ